MTQNRINIRKGDKNKVAKQKLQLLPIDCWKHLCQLNSKEILQNFTYIFHNWECSHFFLVYADTLELKFAKIKLKLKWYKSFNSEPKPDVFENLSRHNLSIKKIFFMAHFLAPLSLCTTFWEGAKILTPIFSDETSYDRSFVVDKNWYFLWKYKFPCI